MRLLLWITCSVSDILYILLRGGFTTFFVGLYNLTIIF